ncbi:MAG: hypothetical protein RLY43_1110 [Bacteroidota bacterium]
MIAGLLSKEIQEFITNSLQSNIAKLALSKNPFPEVEWKEILTQIVSKNKARTKLSTWFKTENIYYPSSLSIEQSSSESTAKFKSSLVKGETLVDLTGGFGVDCYYFSQHFTTVFHCEKNQELADIVAYNFKQLNKNNVKCIAGDSAVFLENNHSTFDWIYVDPSRRNDSKGKVFMLKDCLPNVPENLAFYFEKTNQILLKTAPILDIAAGLKELKNVKSIHVVALDNEVKELLWILEKNYDKGISVSASNLQDKKTDTLSFILDSEEQLTYSLPKLFIYEPNAAILKSGGANYLCTTYPVTKLHSHSHLFTNDKLVDFPGRRFIIDQLIPFNKSEIKKYLQGKKMNITTRNFPLSVEEIRVKYKINDGGNVYAFFTTNLNDEKIVLLCSKI